MPGLLTPSWEQFQKIFARRWNQGEHVFINGQTGSGKTEIMTRLLSMPWQNRRKKYSALLVTKPRDPIFTSEYVKGFDQMKTFNPNVTHSKILLSAPRGDSTRNQVGNQRAVFEHALETMFHQEGWTIGIDETLWISNRLKLNTQVGDIAYLGRALGVTGIYATQRPSHIPVIIPQSATHSFLGKLSRKEDLGRVAELGGDFQATRAAIDSLTSKHDFVYVDSDSTLPLMIVNTHA